MNPQISSLKSSGTYFFEYDMSPIVSANNNLTRLVVGFSKLGPFNTPVYIPNTEVFYNVFGRIDKNLERKKSYFHRTCVTALDNGPIIALNLLRIDSVTDKVNNFICSTSATETNIGLNSQSYSGYYNTEKFWTPDDEAFLNNISSQPSNNRLLNITNLNQKPTSVIIKKTDATNLNGFQITAKEWYGVDNMPSYLHDNDLISDFFVDVILLAGDFGPGAEAQPYARFSTDPLFGKYFDSVKGLKRKLIASDNSDTSLSEFLSLGQVTNIATYRGILLPDFMDKNGNALFIEDLINRETAMTGLFCAVNKDIFADGELISGVDGGIDLIGHNIEYAQPKFIDFLSYKETVKSDIIYDAQLAVTSVLDLTNVAKSDNSAGNVTFTISKASNAAAYDVASTLVSNELVPRVIGSYILSEDGTVFGAVINVIKTATNVYFEIDSLSASDFATATELKFINPSDLKYVIDDSFTYESWTAGKIVGSYGTTLYNDALNGIIVNGDKVYFGLNGAVPGYLAFDLNTTDKIFYDLGGLETEVVLANSSYSIPVVNVSAFETNDMINYVDGFGFSLDFVDTTGTLVLSSQLAVQTLKGSLNKSIPATETLKSTETELDLRYSTSISVDDYIVNDDGVISGGSRLTKISKIVNTGSKLKVTTYGPIKYKTVQGVKSIEVYKPITSWVDYYSVIPLKGFTYTAYHLPDGTNMQQNNILYDTLSGTSLYKALIDKENINYRYIVDSFGNGIEGSSKAILAKLAKDKGDCIALLNAPSYKEFKNSTDPIFTDLTKSVNARLISEGGDLTKNPENVYSLPTTSQGASYAAFFGPYIKVNDNGKSMMVPPAAYVSNLFVNKHITDLPWSVVGGSKRAIISGRNVIGVETSLSREDRDYLEPFGINPIIYQSGIGITIYGNNTAQQSTKSALSSIHVREVLIEIQKGLDNILKKYIFELNTANTRLQIKSAVDNFLNKIKQSNGVYAFKTVMDESNNTNEIIDSKKGIIDVYVEPVRDLEILVGRTVVLSTGGIASGEFSPL